MMDRKQIIDMAHSARVFSGANEFVFAASLERFAALVAAHEREQCAVVCDKMGNPWRGSEDCAAAIRARGEGVKA